MTSYNFGQTMAFKHQQRGLTFYKLGYLLLFIFLLMLMGCEPVPQGETSSNSLVTATWDSSTSTMSISGVAAAGQDNIKIHDAADEGKLLGEAVISDDGSWKASSTTAACEVHVELPSGTATVAVDNAPADCTGSGLAGRVATENDIPAGVLVVSNPEPLNSIPNAVILSPAQNMTINVGQVVNFQGTAVGTNVSPPIYYNWSFGGAASNSNIQNPGPIVFNIPGTYFIQLSVSDNLGIPDPTPAVRTIVVNSLNGPVATTPTPVITSPTAVNGNVSISVGQSLFFSGSASDISGVNSFTYEWNFSGIYPNQFGPTPGSIPFNRAGTYVVTLYATNALGVRSVTPATVTVVVGATAGANQAPSGAIVRPSNDVVINVGESLRFRASGRDPDNNNPLYYSWDFQGVAPAINMSTNQDGGTVTFNTPGIYQVRLSVSDSLGATDPNPPVRNITVQQGTTTTPPPTNGTLSSQIISPPTDVTIAPGQSVFFSGQTIGAGTGAALYFWNFDGAANNSNLQTPGNISFMIPGQFFVTFYATDLNGNVIGTPATRTVTVADPSSVGSGIVSPLDNSSVAIGTPVSLVGRVNNASNFVNLSYEWSIRLRGSNTTVFNSTLLSPGQYSFTQAGQYVVKFRVTGTDAFGNQTVASSSRVNVNVTGGSTIPPGGTNPGTNSISIISPATDMVIYPGTTVRFEANNYGFGAVYNWDFNGVRSPSNQRDPGQVQFNLPGTYYVTLQVAGSSNGIPLNVFGQRVITVMQGTTPVPPPGQFPTSTGILSPATDRVVAPGSRVEFYANDFGLGAFYSWDFQGAAAPSNTRNPPSVVFFTQGTYLVSLRVTGTSNGLPLNVYDKRVITVLGSSPTVPPIPNPNPGAFGTGIRVPATDMVINAGTPVEFKANNLGTAVNYSWDFSGAALPNTNRNPPAVVFYTPGTYRVTLRATGSNNGIPVNISDQRTITVLQSGTPQPPFPNQPPITGASGPEGYIVQPTSSFARVTVGQALQFAGSGFDPLGSGPLQFQWSFGGAQRNIDSQNPGSITFNRVGTYVVTLLVKNAFGQFDLTPSYVVVDVTP